MTITLSKIAIIGGSGKEGRGLALRWAHSRRYQIIIGSREANRAKQVAAELNAQLGLTSIIGLDNEVAAQAGDIVVLSVPYAAHESTLAQLKPHLGGKILVDVTVPLIPPRVREVTLPPGGSAAQAAQALLGSEVQVVSAFQNVSAVHLADPGHNIDCDVLISGNSQAAKATVIELAAAAGMRGLDVGPLQNAVAAESLTAILLGLNKQYRVRGAGIRITGLPPADEH